MARDGVSFGQALNIGGGPPKRLAYIAAATAALRRRLDALKAGYHDSDQWRANNTSAVDSAAVEAKSLMTQLRPLASVAQEFKAKWDKQKAALISQKQAEIAVHLHEESEVATQHAKAMAEQRMAEVARISEQQSRRAADKMGEGHHTQLHLALTAWRSKVKGATAVKQDDVDKAFKGALQRIAAWSAEEERHVMEVWTQELSRVVTAAHTLDEEALAAAEDTQTARQAVLDGAMQRHFRGLQSYRSELHEEVAARAREVQEAPIAGKDGKRTVAQTAAMAAALQKATRARIATAKDEAQAAAEAHRRALQSHLDAVQGHQNSRAAAFSAAMTEAGPMLKARLADELSQSREAAQAALAAEAEEQGRGSDSDSPPNSVAVRTVTPRRQGSTASRKSVVPGQDPSVRASLFQYRTPRETSPGVLSFGQPSDHESEDGESDEDENSAAGDAESMNKQRMERVLRLRAHLEASQAALSKGDWSGDWRHDIAEVVGMGRVGLRDAEAALEGQAAVLRGVPGVDEDTHMFSSAFTNLAMHAKSYAKTVKEEATKTRNVKAGLAMRRAAHVKELMQRHEQAAPAAERDALPFVSKLSRETEVVIEVGEALKRGLQRFPVAVVAGSWRRAIAAALPLLHKVWDGADTPMEEQYNFVNKLLAVIAKTPDGARHLAELKRVSGY